MLQITGMYSLLGENVIYCCHKKALGISLFNGYDSLKTVVLYTKKGNVWTTFPIFWVKTL